LPSPRKPGKFTKKREGHLNRRKRKSGKMNVKKREGRGNAIQRPGESSEKGKDWIVDGDLRKFSQKQVEGGGRKKNSIDKVRGN